MCPCLLPTFTINRASTRKEIQSLMSKRRNRKKSPAKAVIGAALEIAREHAELIEAAKRNTQDDRESVDAKPVSK